MKKIFLLVVIALTSYGCGGDNPPDISDAEEFLKNRFQHNETRTAGTLKPFQYEKVDGMTDEKSGKYVMYINVTSRTLKQATCNDNFKPFLEACVIAKESGAGFSSGKGFFPSPGFFADVEISAPMKVTFDKRESGWVPVRVDEDSERDPVVTASASAKEQAEAYRKQAIEDAKPPVLKAYQSKQKAPRNILEPITNKEVLEKYKKMKTPTIAILHDDGFPNVEASVKKLMGERYTYYKDNKKAGYNYLTALKNTRFGFNAKQLDIKGNIAISLGNLELTAKRDVICKNGGIFKSMCQSNKTRGYLVANKAYNREDTAVIFIRKDDEWLVTDFFYTTAPAYKEFYSDSTLKKPHNGDARRKLSEVEKSDNAKYIFKKIKAHSLLEVFSKKKYKDSENILLKYNNDNTSEESYIMIVIFNSDSIARSEYTKDNQRDGWKLYKNIIIGTPVYPISQDNKKLIEKYSSHLRSLDNKEKNESQLGKQNFYSNEQDNDFVGTWKGSYICSQGETGLTLVIKENSNALEAVFNFYPVTKTSKGKSGSFLLTGKVASDGSFTLKPKKWIKKPKGYRMVEMTGKISKKADQLEGRISFTGCSTFSLIKESSSPSTDVKSTSTSSESGTEPQESFQSLKSRKIKWGDMVNGIPDRVFALENMFKRIDTDDRAEGLYPEYTDLMESIKFLIEQAAVHLPRPEREMLTQSLDKDFASLYKTVKKKNEIRGVGNYINSPYNQLLYWAKKLTTIEQFIVKESSNLMWVHARPTLSLRAKPSTKAEKLARIPYGGMVKLLTKEGSFRDETGMYWRKVDWKGTQGYVAADYLMEFNPKISYMEQDM